MAIDASCPMLQTTELFFFFNTFNQVPLSFSSPSQRRSFVYRVSNHCDLIWSLARRNGRFPSYIFLLRDYNPACTIAGLCSQVVPTFGLQCEIVLEHQSLHPEQCLCALEQLVTFPGLFTSSWDKVALCAHRSIIVQAHTQLVLLIKSIPSIANELLGWPKQPLS